MFEIHSPHCEVPTGETGTVTTRCAHGAIIRDASICGATKPCPIHGGEFPDEADVPIDVRRELMKAAVHKQIDYYWLCAVYRKGRTDAEASLSTLRSELEKKIEEWRVAADEMTNIRPPEGWPEGWEPPIQSKENKAYCDGKARGLRMVADTLSRLTSQTEP